MENTDYLYIVYHKHMNWIIFIIIYNISPFIIITEQYIDQNWDVQFSSSTGGWTQTWEIAFDEQKFFCSHSNEQCWWTGGRWGII